MWHAGARCCSALIRANVGWRWRCKMQISISLAPSLPLSLSPSLLTLSFSLSLSLSLFLTHSLTHSLSLSLSLACWDSHSRESYMSPLICLAECLRSQRSPTKLGVCLIPSVFFAWQTGDGRHRNEACSFKVGLRKVPCRKSTDKESLALKSVGFGVRDCPTPAFTDARILGILPFFLVLHALRCEDCKEPSTNLTSCSIWKFPRNQQKSSLSCSVFHHPATTYGICME